jgi:serine phosphatase RsbU (regulator of sigma subunit)
MGNRFSTQRVRFGIPAKAAVVIVAALSLTTGATVWVGSGLMIDDKIATIFESSLNQVRIAGTAVDRDLQGWTDFLSGVAAAGTEVVSPEFGTRLGWLGTNRFALYRKSAPQAEWARVAQGANLDWVEQQLARTGWLKEIWEEGSRVRISAGDAGTMIGLARVSASRGEWALAAQYVPRRAPALEVPLAIFTREGAFFGGQESSSFWADEPEFRALAKELSQAPFAEGVRQWTPEGRPTELIAHQKAANGELVAISRVPRDEAYASATILRLRVFLTGAGVAFAGIGSMLFLMGGLTRRLKVITGATEKVGHGDFTFRVPIREKRVDELDVLGTAFNHMSAEIQALILKTAHAARMEKELETAQLVQRRFTPSGDVQRPEFTLAGRLWPASECAGDWWHYSAHEQGRRLVIAIGDVTGHGVSSALITAAAHAGFHGALHRLDGTQTIDEWVSELLEATNHAVFVSAKNESEMSFSVSVVDFVTGEMAYGSAGHHPQYLRSASGPLKPLIPEQSPQLGKSPRLGTKASRVQLHAGDRIIWYTDGLIEGKDAAGSAIGKSRFQRAIRSTASADSEPAAQWLSKIMQGTVGCPPEELAKLERADDITVIAFQFRSTFTGRSGSEAPGAPPPFSPKSAAA